MSDVDALLASLSPRNTDKGRQFERLAAWFLRNDPTYRTQLAEVWLWDEWPERWGDEAGIDLVARTHDGQLWAIQAKAHAPEYYVTKDDLNTFLSESSRQQFSYRLLIATTNRMGRIARRTIDAQEKPVGLLMRGDLERADVVWPTSLDDLRPAPSRRKQQLPHSRIAVDAICRGFAEHPRGQAVMACGTGKTLIGLWTAEELKAERTLVLVPSLFVLSQTLREWSANAVGSFRTLVVCSDDTVTGQDDAYIEHVSELGMPVTTDPTRMAAFLADRGRCVVFSTYQSSPQLGAMAATTPAFDLVIADEAHRCAGPVEGAFATVLREDAIRAGRRLFLTATPRYVTGQVRGQAAAVGYEYASMDDVERFGPVFHRLTFREAMDEGLLADYRVVVVGVDDDMYRDLIDHAALVRADEGEVTDARSLAGQVALSKAMREFDLRRVLSFHGRVRAAADFSDAMAGTIAWLPPELRPSGRLWTGHVSGAMASGQRDVLLSRFQHLKPDERGLLSNARCLSEGVNVPSIDGVAFIDPRHSTIDIIQAVGRAIRRSEEKTSGTIVLPIYLGRDESLDGVVSRSPFKVVWQVLQALRAHDEDLADELDAVRRELGRRGSGALRMPRKVTVDLPAGVDADFAHALALRIVEFSSNPWEYWFGLLERFVDREHHANVPTAHLENDEALGRWVGYQRGLRSRLAEERRLRLETLPGWSWNALDSQWAEGLGVYRQYAERTHGAPVPTGHEENGFPLGLWVSNQRSKLRRGKLKPERVRELEAIPGWVPHAREARWETAFAHLLAFTEREKHALVPLNYEADGFKLGAWVVRQRAAKGLSSDRVRRLEALPKWSWHTVRDRWETGFDVLGRYVDVHRSAAVSQQVMFEGFALGRWCSSQRVAGNEGSLSVERRRRLDALPGWTWDARETAWEEGYAWLRRYTEEHGSPRVPPGAEYGGYPLGDWVRAQRRAYGRKELSPSRVGRLEQLPNWSWDPLEDDWELNFAALCEYVGDHGAASPPSTFKVSGVNLGAWVNTQRQQYKKQTLRPDRAVRLADLPGWEWNPKDAQWDRSFEALLQHVRVTGTARITQGATCDVAVRRWVTKQRSSRRAGTLREDRIERLQQLPDWVW